MDYEIVNLEEKQVVGLSAITNNGSPDMGATIGSLWGRFYGEDIYPAIKSKKNEKALGIYTDYKDREKDDYTVMAACEVEEAKELPLGAEMRVLPAGRYARFVVTGDMHKAVADFWSCLWDMDLPRSFVCDFEEYQNSDMEQAEIHIYIGIREEDK